MHGWGKGWGILLWHLGTIATINQRSTVNRFANNTLKLVATLLSTAVAFGLGFVGVWNYYERWVLSEVPT
jgi:hypothetical protein